MTRYDDACKLLGVRAMLGMYKWTYTASVTRKKDRSVMEVTQKEREKGVRAAMEMEMEMESPAFHLVGRRKKEIRARLAGDKDKSSDESGPLEFKQRPRNGWPTGRMLVPPKVPSWHHLHFSPAPGRGVSELSGPRPEQVGPVRHVSRRTWPGAKDFRTPNGSRT